MTRSGLRSLVPLLLALAAVAGTAAADSIVTTDAFLPVVHIVGANGIYYTDVSIFNTSDSDAADVYVYFEAADTDGTNAPGIHFTNGIGPRRSVTLVDALASQFHTTSGYGMLEVYSKPTTAYPNGVPIIVTSNTYNVAGAAPGTFGQFSPGQPERNSVGFGNTNDYDLYVPGIPHDQNHVTNAVVMNPSNKPLYGTMELVDNTGAIWARMQNIYVPPFSMHQLNNVFGSVFASANPPYDTAWRLNFYVGSNTGATLLAYVTIQDRRSGDPYLVPAAAQVANVPAVRPKPDGSVRAVAPLAVRPSPPAADRGYETTPVTRESLSAE